MELYPKLVVEVDPASLPVDFVADDVVPNWGSLQNEWRSTFPNSGPPSGRWGVWGWEGTKDRLRGPLSEDRSLWSVKIHGWSTEEPNNPVHTDVIADLDASDLGEDMKAMVRSEFPVGVVFINWHWAIKTHMEWSDIHGRDERVEAE